MYRATLLRAPNRRLTKLYQDDPYSEPQAYDGAARFRVSTLACETMAEFARALAALPSDTCMIRGKVRRAMRAEAKRRLVKRRRHDRPGEPATFEPCRRPWIVLDLDESGTPFDPDDIRGSIEAWRRTLPPAIREAESAFVLSSQSHRSKTVRGKLIVALSDPLDDTSAAAWAKAHGFDGSVCHATQPNYFAPPVFEGCEDPFEGRRDPILFPGRPTRLPRVEASTSDAGLGDRANGLPEPELTERARELAVVLEDHWLEGERITDNRALHLCGWLLGQEWSRAEVVALVAALDSDEPDATKRAEHLRIAGNARAIEGPGSVRSWVEGANPGLWARVDKWANYVPGLDEWASRSKIGPVEDRAAFTIVDRSVPPPELEYVIDGLDLAPGKVSAIQAFANVAKTPVALLLALCVASGEDFLGFPVAQRNAMFLAFEGGILTETREARMCAGLGLDRASVPLHYARCRTRLSDAFLAELREYVETHEIGLVVVDTYGSALPYDVDSNSSRYAYWLQVLGDLSDETDTCIVVLLHENKGQAGGLRAMSGHNAAPGAVQAAIRLVRANEDKTVVDVECAREVRRAFAPFAIQFEDVPNSAAPTGLALVARKVDATTRGGEGKPKAASGVGSGESAHVVRDAGLRMVERLKAGGGGLVTRTELRAASGEGKTPADRALALLVDADLVECTLDRYALTEAGHEARRKELLVALGSVGGFGR